MSRRLLTISAAVLVLTACFANAQTAPPTATMVQCSSTSDCASATCCGISVCVNRQFAPSANACTSVECPRETPGPVMSCECDSNTCRTRKDSVIVGEPATNAPGMPPPTPDPTFTEPADSLMACSADSDCGMQTCCEAQLCIAKRFAPDCSRITGEFCPAMQFNCQCTNNRCARGATPAPPTTASSPTTASPQTTFVEDDGADANTDSAAYTMPILATVATGVVACLVVHNL